MAVLVLLLLFIVILAMWGKLPWRVRLPSQNPPFEPRHLQLVMHGQSGPWLHSAIDDKYQDGKA
jgi:hypothetical protein